MAKSKNKLAPKHKKFILEYLKTLNATKSAIFAGYSEKSARSQGTSLLSNPNILKKINESLDKILKDNEKILQKKIIDEAERVALADITKIDLKVDGSVVQQIEYSFDGEGKKYIRKIKLHPKIPAIEILCKYLKLYQETSNININQTVEIIDESRKRE